jgi:hypothetical protein
MTLTGILRRLSRFFPDDSECYLRLYFYLSGGYRLNLKAPDFQREVELAEAPLP